MPAHSLAEVHLYLMVRRCDHCDEGPLRGAASLREEIEGRQTVTIQAKCARCGEDSWLLFQIPGGAETHPVQAAASRRINPTDERSQILDVAQWITLCRIMLNAAERIPDRHEAREMRCDAGECLEEALRFYSAESDLPPADAFFTERSAGRLRDRPELYIRQALIAKRQELPSRQDSARSGPRTGVAGVRQWWQFWKKPRS